MRERLIQLIKHDNCINPYNCSDKCKYVELDDCHSARLADYLLKNGVVVLPCKVGDVVYVIQRCRCGKPENYNLQCCGKKVTSKTPKVLSRVMCQEIGKKLKWHNTGKMEYEVVPKGTICYSLYEKQFTLKMLTEIGKTVFITREEAEKALKEGAE
jgi:hypothetical protein